MGACRIGAGWPWHGKQEEVSEPLLSGHSAWHLRKHKACSMQNSPSPAQLHWGTQWHWVSDRGSVSDHSWNMNSCYLENVLQLKDNLLVAGTDDHREGTKYIDFQMAEKLRTHRKCLLLWLRNRVWGLLLACLQGLISLKQLLTQAFSISCKERQGGLARKRTLKDLNALPCRR